MSTPKTPGKRRRYRKKDFYYDLLEDPKRVKDFLKRAKILQDDGQLAPPYRRHRAKLRFLADQPLKEKPPDDEAS